jgi:hypothetical protein
MFKFANFGQALNNKDLWKVHKSQFLLVAGEGFEPTTFGL